MTREKLIFWGEIFDAMWQSPFDEDLALSEMIYEFLEDFYFYD